MAEFADVPDRLPDPWVASARAATCANGWSSDRELRMMNGPMACPGHFNLSIAPWFLAAIGTAAPLTVAAGLLEPRPTVGTQGTERPCGVVEVVDGRSRPVVGARVSISTCDPSGDCPNPIGSREWLTDRRGQACVIDSLDSKGTLKGLEIDAPSLRGGACAGSKRLRYEPRRDVRGRPEEIRVVLDLVNLARTRLRGRILSRDGRPVRGAKIDLEHIAVQRQCSFSPQLPTATSVSDGTFAFPDLPGDSAILHVRHPAYAPRSLEVQLLAGLQTIELQPGSTWRGRVLSTTRAVIADCRLSLEVKSETVASSRCSPEGFSLEHLPSGDARLLISTGDQSVLGMRSLKRTVHIGAGNRQEDIVWPAGTTIDGDIVRPSGEPVPGAHLSAMPKGPNGYPLREGQVTAQADRLGHFVLQDLPPGAWILTADLRESHRTSLEVDGTTNRSAVRLLVPPPPH